MWHISKDGIARKCDADTPEKCRAQGDVLGHFSTQEEAEQAFEDYHRDKLFSVHKLVTNDVDSAFEGESDEYEDDDTVLIDGNTMAEGIIIQDLEYIETRIDEHKENVDNGIPISNLDDWHDVELGAEYDGVNASDLARAWDRQDYDSVRRQYAEALSRANNSSGEVRLTPDELIDRARGEK